MSEVRDLTEEAWRVLESVADVLIVPTSPERLKKIAPNATPQELEVVGTKSPSQLPHFRQTVRRMFAAPSAEAWRKMNLVFWLLTRRGFTTGLTGTFSTLDKLTPADRLQVLLSLRSARISGLRMLFRTLLDLSLVGYLYGDPLVTRTSGYVDPNPILETLKGYDLWEVPIAELPPAIGNGPSHIEVDVVIVGSGSSANVAAHRLSKQGLNVLILEKASYLHPSLVGLTDLDKDEQAFESAGKIQSTDVSITVIAGSTIGGGSAVNWSATLDTPPGIRREWVDRGVPFYGTTVYDDALAYTKKVMEVTEDFGAHSFTNQLILDGAKKLDWKAKVVPQNTGRHIPNNRFHGYGYRYGDKGGVVNWLYTAMENGVRLIDKAEVVNIRHRNGHASGVEVLVDGKPLVVSAKRVIVAAGSLRTPHLLLRSGFKNKHIGQGLKLHPVTTMMGLFPHQVVNKPDDTIMTAVCTQVDNLDGRHHGPKIEAIQHQPLMISKFLPWRSPQQYHELLIQYRHISSLLIITRDKDHGSVEYRSNDPRGVYVNYSPSAYDIWALKEGCLAGSDLLYVEGAERLLPPVANYPDFVSTRPKDERRLHDEDYQKWRRGFEDTDFNTYNFSKGSAHQMASVRMSNRGPSYAAVNERGQLYECENVHVIDTSVFPSASGVNPMLTCMATAHVLSGYLVEEIEKTKRARL